MATSLKKLYLRGCSSLVEIPSSIGNAANLTNLNLSECSSLVELPSSIGNLSNLQKLYLGGCSSLVELPSSIGNLTNLKFFYLTRCSSLVELPSSIGNLTNLQKLYLGGCSSLVELLSSIMSSPLTSYFTLDLVRCSSLVELPSSIGNLTFLSEIYLRGCSSVVELPSSIGNLTNLQQLILEGCSSLVSLPQLPDSLLGLNAENCVSLEKLDCSFSNPDILLNFANCSNLNKEARDLIIQKSTLQFVVLPGKEVPACFTYRASGNSVTVKLNQKPLRTSNKFKACILFVENGVCLHSYYGNIISVNCTKKNKAGILLNNKGEHEVGIRERGSVSCHIKGEPNNPLFPLCPMLTEHLYIFEVEVEEVMISTELVFDFKFPDGSSMREIKECGMF